MSYPVWPVWYMKMLFFDSVLFYINVYCWPLYLKSLGGFKNVSLYLVPQFDSINQCICFCVSTKLFYYSRSVVLLEIRDSYIPKQCFYCSRLLWLVCLWGFHLNLEIHFSIYVKKGIGVLIGTPLKMYLAFGRMAIFMILPL